MSGTLVIREDATWMPTAWVFCRILENINAELEQSESSIIIDNLNKAIVTGYGDLQQLSKDQIQTLLDVAEQAYSREAEQGLDSFSPPSDYFSLMYSFSQLIALFKTDIRYQPSRRSTYGTIIVRDTAIWSAPEWTFVLVLEHLDAHIRANQESPELTSLFLAARKSVDLRCDLRFLDEYQISKVILAAEWMYAHYGDGKGRLSHAPSFFSELGKHITVLFNLLEQTL